MATIEINAFHRFFDIRIFLTLIETFPQLPQRTFCLIGATGVIA
jgi:hypothetical protein